jgi:HK97 gp10 family phage protein
VARRTSTRQNQNFNLGFALEELGINVKRAGFDALVAGANIIVADAKSRIHNVSGELSASVDWKPNRSGNKIVISANAKNKKGKMYGRLVEWWPGREHPFMYPAYDANRNKVREDIIEAIREAVSKLGKS